MYAPAASDASTPADFLQARFAAVCRLVRPGQDQALDLDFDDGRSWPPRHRSSPDPPTISGSQRRLETSLQLLYQPSWLRATIGHDRADGGNSTRRSRTAAGIQPGVRREISRLTPRGTSPPGRSPAIRSGAHDRQKMLAFYRRVRERRRLHILHGGRVQDGPGDRCWPGISAACPRPGARRRSSRIGIQFPVPCSAPASGREPGAPRSSAFRRPAVRPMERTDHRGDVHPQTVLPFAARGARPTCIGVGLDQSPPSAATAPFPNFGAAPRTSRR